LKEVYGTQSLLHGLSLFILDSLIVRS